MWKTSEDPDGPKLFDIYCSIREDLVIAGITPNVDLRTTLEEFEQNGASVQLRAA